ncbi:MAG TPA: CocE/NonD family hydrolase [Aliidongia sp.]|nr:CocE/NonD family hydrolase [Aliidongia sp.]
MSDRASIFQVLACVGLWLFATGSVPAFGDEADNAEPGIPLNEQILQIPGDPAQPVMLQVTVFMPNGPGPFPLAVMNHGADGSSMPPAEQPRYRNTYAAYYFLSRGYAVALPMMRGFAGSGGRLESHGCDDLGFGITNAKDIRAVIGYMARQPGIDGTRVVVAGQSFGGFNTLALGMLNMPNVKGLVNFSGGLIASNCARPDDSLIAAAATMGSQTATRSIWFYGDNDKLFAASTWHAMHQRYLAAGGNAELVAYGTFMSNAHQFLSFPESQRIWVPKLDAFLTKVGLPGRPVHPEYMPMAVPPATHYAAVEDTASVPYLKDQGRALYQQFLEKPAPRAAAIGANGTLATANGGFDPLARALAACGRKGAECRLYAVDSDVVWAAPMALPSPTGFAALSDQNAVPYLSTKGREGYLQFLTLKTPRAFVIAPDGAWYGTSRGIDPLARALDACRQAHQACQLYAVDENVVWPKDSAIQ